MKPLSTRDISTYDEQVREVYKEVTQHCDRIYLPSSHEYERINGVNEVLPSFTIIPGAFYKEFPQHDARGERFAKCAAAAGIAVSYVNTPSFL